MKIGVLTRERMLSVPRGTLGSSLIRGDWLVSCDPEHFEHYKDGERYTAVILQKVYRTPYDMNHPVILDVVDPDWHDDRCGTFRNGICPAISLANAVTVPTEALAKTIRDEFDDVKPIVIPDRTWLPYFNGEKKMSLDRFKTVGWFGYPENFPVIKQMLPAINDLRLNLIVFSTERYGNARFTKYNRDTINDDLMLCDCLITPRLNSPFFAHKSDSKLQWGAALGIPVATTADELRSFADPVVRIDAAAKQWGTVCNHKRMKDSCDQFLGVANSLVQMLLVS